MDASTEYTTNENNETRMIVPTELEDTVTVDDEYLSKWNTFIESSDLDDWNEDD